MKDVGTILAWFDLETTGLDPKTGRILEYAVVFTDLELTRLATMGSIIKQDVEGAKALMDDYCLKMHSDNGLLAEIETAGLGRLTRYEDHLHLADMAIARCARALREQYTD